MKVRTEVHFLGYLLAVRPSAPLYDDSIEGSSLVRLAVELIYTLGAGERDLSSSMKAVAISYRVLPRFYIFYLFRFE